MIKPTNIHTSGGVFTHHFIESILQDRVGHPALKAETFTLPNYDRLTEKAWEAGIAETWEDLVQRWDAVEREFGALDISALRRRWLLPLFKALGFNLEFNKGDLVLEEDYRFPISHLGWAGTSSVTVPIHTLLYVDENTLETKAMPGRGIKAMAPHDMLQRYLNLSPEHRWGLLTDGVALRLVRDYYHTYTRGYTEFDLQGIFSTRDYASFRALFRLLHASRFITPEGQDQTPIDDLYEDALAMGVAVGKDLRENVQKAIESLGNGFLRSTPGLLEQLRSQDDGAQDLYHEILVTIYRVLFLLFAEQRGMLPGRGSLYMEEFSLTALRTLAERPRGDDPNADLWEKLKTTFAMLEHGVDELGIFPYNGALFSLARTPLLTPPGGQPSPRCRNDALLAAVRHLTTVEKDRVLQRISYADLSVEEIGSIYESLLEITPRITTSALTVDDRQVPSNTFFLDLRGLGRKTTGSYYTPPALVNELIKSALEPVMENRLQSAVPGYEAEMVEVLNESEQQLAEAALLGIKVVDPAAGSGAFLIAANNRLGLELARVRSGSLFPAEKDIRRARRDVLAGCIHGVDLNPMAVELCKVSLWINAAVEDAPLNFLDHHIQCGNSLVGATPELVKGGIPNEAYNAVTGDDKKLATALKRQNRQERDGQASLGFTVTLIRDEDALKQWLRARDLADTQPSTAEKAFTKFQTSREYWAKRLPYDLWTAAFFAPLQPDQPVPTTDDVRLALNNPEEVSEELRLLARELAEKHRFFHWHLAFPEVFDEHGQGGFDVVLGNPPWERPELEEDNFFKEYIPEIIFVSKSSERKELISKKLKNEPEIEDKYMEEQRFFETHSKYVRHSGTYYLTSSGKYNYYALFAELSLNVLSEFGYSGLILQSGIATDDTNKEYFSHVAKENKIVSYFDFENRKVFFPNIHASYRFCLFTINSKIVVNKPKYAFLLHNIDEINNDNKTCEITWSDIKKIRPNTGTVPIFNNKLEANLARKVYSEKPVIDNEENLNNPWNYKVTRIFNMGVNEISKETKTREYLNSDRFFLLGNILESSDNTIFLPIYEAKLMNQYNHRFSTYENVKPNEALRGKTKQIIEKSLKNRKLTIIPRFWMPLKMMETTTGLKIKNKNWMIAYRDIARATDERTMIACIIPKSAPDLTLRIVITNYSSVEACELLSNFNSFVFDFFVRLSTSGTHLSDYVVKQLPVIPPFQYTNEIKKYIVPKVLELTYTSWDLLAFANDIWLESTNEIHEELCVQSNNSIRQDINDLDNSMVPDWVTKHYLDSDKSLEVLIPPLNYDIERRFNFQSDLDALFGHLYNLTRDEFAYILDTFPIVRRKDEAEYGEYRTKRVILEKFDALSDDSILEGACLPLNERVSVLKKSAKSQAKKPLPSSKPSGPKLEPKHQSNKPEFKQAEQSQPELPTAPAVKEPQPTPISDYTLYRCPICDKRVLGFDRDTHTREVHAGVDPGYEKMS